MNFTNIHICGAGDPPVPYVKWELYDFIAVYNPDVNLYHILFIREYFSRGRYRNGDNINAHTVASLVREALTLSVVR